MITANELIKSVDHAVKNGNQQDKHLAWLRVEEAHDKKDISDYAKAIFRKRLAAVGYTFPGGRD